MISKVQVCIKNTFILFNNSLKKKQSSKNNLKSGQSENVAIPPLPNFFSKFEF